MRPLRRILIQAVSLLLVTAAVAQEKKAVTPAPEAAAKVDIDIDDLVHESQQTIRGPGRTGMVWWIPAEFWEASARQNGVTGDAAAQFQSLRDYTMVVVAAGNISTFGSIKWISQEELRSSIRLKDAPGKEYEPFKTVSGDVAIIAAVIRPVLTNALGPMGEHMEVFMFPARDAAGKTIADPTSIGSFSIVLNEIQGFGASVHGWSLPLTSLSPPKFCPGGKERVQANWKFCPWHGNRLDGSVEAKN